MLIHVYMYIHTSTYIHTYIHTYMHCFFLGIPQYQGSVEAKFIAALSPHPSATLVRDPANKTYVASFDTGREKIEKTCESLALCLSWIGRMQHAGTRGKWTKEQEAQTCKNTSEI